MTTRRPTHPIQGQTALIDADQLPAGSIVAKTYDNPTQARMAWKKSAWPQVEEFACGLPVDADFQIHEAAKAMGIEEPPNPKSDWGGLAREMHEGGSLDQVVMATALKLTCKKSLLWRWRASAALRAKRSVSA
jgi:hypothetical protein